MNEVERGASGGEAALLVLLARTAGAGFIAPDLWTGTDVLRGRRVMMTVVAVRAMDVAGVVVVAMIVVVIAIWPVDMRGGLGGAVR